MHGIFFICEIEGTSCKRILYCLNCTVCFVIAQRVILTFVCMWYVLKIFSCCIWKLSHDIAVRAFWFSLVFIHYNFPLPHFVLLRLYAIRVKTNLKVLQTLSCIQGVYPPYLVRRLWEILTSAGMWYRLNILTLSRILDGTSDVVVLRVVVVVEAVVVVVGTLMFLCTRTILSNKLCLEGWWSSGWNSSSSSSGSILPCFLRRGVPCFFNRVVPPSLTEVEVTTSVPSRSGLEVKNWWR